jgi:hypothetical protein
MTDKCWPVRMATSGKLHTAVQLTRELNKATGKKFSVQTVRRALKEAGLKAGPKK